jgi:hypothetical protein
MRRLGALVFALALVLAMSATAYAAKPADTGFNANGYNYNARIFSGTADGVDKLLDGMVWGDPTYAKDHLVMKWNAAWDACNANGYDSDAFCLGAWDTNEWNGNVPGGSGETDHAKIIWVGSLANHGLDHWVDGGLRIWGNYEIIFEQGNYGTGHEFYVKSARPGLGG